MYEYQNSYGYQPQYPNYGNAPRMQAQQIIRVNGLNGAQAFQMGANCSALLLDETAPRVFLAQTDGAGYKSLKAYGLTEYKEEQEVTNQDLLNRIIKLEEIINEQSNTRHDTSTESNKRNSEKSKQNVRGNDEN